MTALNFRPIEVSKVLVLGVARNCATTLEPTLAALRETTGGFRASEFLIVESDSTDGTSGVLDRLASAGPLRAISLGNLRRDMPFRTQRLAHCRNRLVEEAASVRYRDADFVVVADLDGVNSSVTRTGFESAWNVAEAWDVVTANQRGPYYDIWALRHPMWCPGDCWEEYRQLRTLFGDAAAYQLAIRSRQMRLPSRAGLVEVDSAFGGLGIYKWEAFVAGTYVGLNEHGREVCEHVNFHTDLRKHGFRIFINSTMQNSTQLEHVGKKNPFKKLEEKIKGLFYE